MEKIDMRALNTAHLKYQAAIGVMEGKIAGYVDFDFSIIDQPGDGLCVLNYDTSDVAPLDRCLDLINTGERLTIGRHKIECI